MKAREREESRKDNVKKGLESHPSDYFLITRFFHNFFSLLLIPSSVF